MLSRLLPRAPSPRAARRLFQLQAQTLCTHRTQQPFPAFVFDIDGVFLQGSKILDQGKEALRMVTGANKSRLQFPFVLLTNGGGVLEEARARLLTQQLGIDIHPRNLIQSHTPLRRYADSFGSRPVLIVGGRGDACRDIAESYGFRQAYTPRDFLRWNPDAYPFSKPPAPEPGRKLTCRPWVPDFAQVEFAAILVFHDSTDWGLDIQVITDIARSRTGCLSRPRDRQKDAWAPEDQIPVHFSNPDLIFKGGFPLSRFGQGAFQNAARSVYQTITGHPLHCATHGKPTLSTYRFAEDRLRALGATMASTYMIGDNPESDIAGGNNASRHAPKGQAWATVLLETGVYDAAQGEPPHRPTVIKKDVLEAVRWIFEREGIAV